MKVTPTKLKQKATGELVEAQLFTKLELGDLLDAESAWTPWRFGMIKRLYAAGIATHEWPQHWHWNWVHKLLSSGSLDIGSALSPLRLMGIKCDADWQGLVLATCVGHQTRTEKGGKDLLYVKYLETAPWNLLFDQIGQEPRFSGTGRQLMELCVRLSQALELKGRVGLHALPQAHGFYRRCGMTDLGKDQNAQDLRYFEMTEGQASAFLTTGRTEQ